MPADLVDQARLGAEFETRLRDERRAWETALAAQDHRLIASLSTLFKTVLLPSTEPKRERIVASLGAIAWCLVPTAGTSAVGIVALASLLIAWQQTRLLSVQNDKIEVQNMLSEAQRRSGLLFETTAIFQAIDEEKKSAIAKSCVDENSESCWIRVENSTSLFHPSSATIGRIAALTQALRPYRYLSVEETRPYRFVGSGPEKEFCTQAVVSESFDRLRQLFSRSRFGNSDDDIALRDPSKLKAEAIKIYAPLPNGQNRIKRAINWAIDVVKVTAAQLTSMPDVDRDVALSCAAASPERGQLLVSLHAASIDISRIAERGGDFRYADIPGAFLEKIVLRKVDLAFARLPGASFRDAILEEVKFTSAHLSGTRFLGARLRKVDFNDAVIQSLNDGAASAGPFTAKEASGNYLEGMKFVEQRAKGDLHSRLCIALRLLSRLTPLPLSEADRYLPMMGELRRFAILVERRPISGRDQLIAKIVEKSHEDRIVVYGDHPEGDEVKKGELLAEYTPFSLCEWPAEPKANE